MSSNDKKNEESTATTPTTEYTRRETNWFTTLWHLHIHVFALYGILLVYNEAQWLTIIVALAVGTLSLLGVTAGAHRLWAHRSYSASLPLRIFLLLCQTASGTGSVYDWVLEHRIHHRFHGTKDDPFNFRRGFLYAQILNRMESRPANWNNLEKQIDMSDIEEDSLVMFQKRFYWILMPVLAFLLPVNFAAEYFNESIFISFAVVFVLRYVIVLHGTWLISSAYSVWGLRQEKNFSYDTNLVFMLNLSMWPHYHYLLPWDYMTGEYGTYGSGCTTKLIRAWAALGWAWGLRTVDTWSVRSALESSARDGKSLMDAVEEQGRLYTERIKSEHLLKAALQF